MNLFFFSVLSCHMLAMFRPDWDKFQEHLLPEDGDWAEIRNCRTSRQMSEAVLAKLDGQPLPELVDGKHGPQAFVAKVTDSVVVSLIYRIARSDSEVNYTQVWEVFNWLEPVGFGQAALARCAHPTMICRHV